MSQVHRTKEWAALSRKLRPQIEAALPLPCIQPTCRHLIMPGSKWHLGHRLDAAKYPALAYEPSNIGPACPRANLADGGRAGAAKTNARNARKKTGPNW